MDKQAETKFKLTQDLKKRYNLKLAIAQKEGNTQEVT